MRKLRSLIADAIVVCLARADSVSPAEVLDYLETTGGVELEVHSKEILRKGLHSIIRDMLRTTTLDDGVRTREPTEMPLPGFKPPTTLAVKQPNGDYRYIPFVKLTLSAYKQALETRRNSIGDDLKSLQDLEQKLDRLYPYLSRADTMTVGDALRLLAPKQAA